MTTRQAHEQCACRASDGRPHLTPEAVLAALTGQVRRGLPDGGAWRAFAAADHTGKTIVCSAFDGDLEARAARYLFEADPSAVPELLAITARAAGATRAILAVPSGLGDVLPALARACEDISSAGGLTLALLEAPNALVLAEPTALLRLLEGRQAIPYLPEGGPLLTLDDAPALVVTAEALAGATGTLGGRADTVLVTLTGDVRYPQTAAVPAETTLGALVRDVGGGGTDGRSIKAVQLGGPAGVYIGADALDKMTVADLRADSRAYCPTLVHVIADGRCMVEAARGAEEFLHSQSCGKCVFCREGTRHLSQLLGELLSGEGNREDLMLIEELGSQMTAGCVCALGRASALPILSSLSLFREDFETHLRREPCPAIAEGGGING